MRIGIFGGCFDPIHLGHLLIAEDVFRKLHLDRIIFIPTFYPPHRKKTIVTYHHRIAMVQLAIAHHPAFSVSRIEETIPTPSYTSETLLALKKQLPRDSLYLLIGSDQYRTMSSWHHPTALTRRARLVVMTRPGFPCPQLFPGHNPRRVLFVNVIPVSLTATMIRQRLAKAMSICYLVPTKVAEYIYQNRLYRTPVEDETQELTRTGEKNKRN